MEITQMFSQRNLIPRPKIWIMCVTVSLPVWRIKYKGNLLLHSCPVFLFYILFIFCMHFLQMLFLKKKKKSWIHLIYCRAHFKDASHLCMFTSVLGHTFSILYFSMSVPYLGNSRSLNKCQFAQSGELSPITLRVRPLYSWISLHVNKFTTEVIMNIKVQNTLTLYYPCHKIELLQSSHSFFSGLFLLPCPFLCPSCTDFPCGKRSVKAQELWMSRHQRRSTVVDSTCTLTRSLFAVVTWWNGDTHAQKTLLIN